MKPVSLFPVDAGAFQAYIAHAVDGNSTDQHIRLAFLARPHIGALLQGASQVGAVERVTIDDDVADAVAATENIAHHKGLQGADDRAVLDANDLPRKALAVDKEIKRRHFVGGSRTGGQGHHKAGGEHRFHNHSLKYSNRQSSKRQWHEPYAIARRRESEAP